MEERARLIDVLAAAAEGSTAAREIVYWALRRERLGGLGTEELIASALIAAIDQPPSPWDDLPQVRWRSTPLRLDWYTQDAHTAIGRRVLGIHSRSTGVPAETIRSLMFCFESTMVRPQERSPRWRSEAVAHDAAEGVGETLETARASGRTTVRTSKMGIDAELATLCEE